MTAPKQPGRGAAWRLVLTLALSLGCLPLGAKAQFSGTDPIGDTAGAREPEKKTRRSKSWFVRPAKSTPREQMIYADSLRDRSPKKARKQYRALVSRWPDSAEAPAAQRAYAEMLLEIEKYQKAFDEYQYLIDRYAGQFPDYDVVLEEQFEIARLVGETRSGGFLFFPSFDTSDRAVPMYESIVENGPQTERAAEAQYLMGSIQEEHGEYEEAIVSYQTGLHRYPDSPFAEKCAYGRAYCLYQLALENESSVDSLREARAGLVLFINTFPGSDNVPIAREYANAILRRLAKVAYDEAVFYDRIAKKPKAALAAYEEFLKSHPNSEWTGVAEIRIDALSQTVKEEDDL